MTGETVLTPHDLQTQFRDERDEVTYAPYRVGDRVVRCSHCRAVIKTEFVTDNCCPLCGARPFRTAPVILPPVSCHVRPRHDRSLLLFFVLLVLSVALTFLPFCFPGVLPFFQKAVFVHQPQPCLTFFAAASIASALVLFCSGYCRRMWRSSPDGWQLVLVPTLVPYLLVAALWIIGMAIAIALVGLIFYLLLLLLNVFAGG